MRLHVLCGDLVTERRAVAEGADVIQLRIKDASTAELVAAGQGFADLGATFVVDDDVEAAIALAADGVHLGRSDEGAERALAAGLLLGLSAATPEQAREAEERGAAYVGAGAVWATPSKPDAGAIGLDGLAAIFGAVSIPVVAIGGVDAANARSCIEAGAAGVAVIRAVTETRALRRAVDEALAAR